MYLKKKYLFAVIFFVLWVAGCSKPQLRKCDGPSPAARAEHYLDKFSKNPQLQLKGDALETYQTVVTHEYVKTRQKKGDHKIYPYHHAVVAYEDYQTRFPLFLVGIEKPRGEYKRPYCKPEDNACNFPKFDPSQFKGDSNDIQGEIEDTQDDIEDRLFNDPRSMVPTHILKAGKTTSDKDQKACFVFNIYGDEGSTPWCNNSLHPIDVVTGMDWRSLERAGSPWG